jgi:hypothetical protein
MERVSGNPAAFSMKRRVLFGRPGIPPRTACPDSDPDGHLVDEHGRACAQFTADSRIGTPVAKKARWIAANMGIRFQPERNATRHAVCSVTARGHKGGGPMCRRPRSIMMRAFIDDCAAIRTRFPRCTRWHRASNRRPRIIGRATVNSMPSALSSQQVQDPNGPRSLFDLWRQMTLEPCLAAGIELVAVGRPAAEPVAIFAELHGSWSARPKTG